MCLAVSFERCSNQGAIDMTIVEGYIGKWRKDGTLDADALQR